LILVDPPIDDVYFADDGKDVKSKAQFHVEPFLGTYEDFMEPLASSEGFDPPQIRLGRGMSEDLGQYWQRGIPVCFDPKHPTIQSLAYFPLRIVAAEWVKYIAVMHDCLVGHEYKSNEDPALEEFDTRLQELQSWRRRSKLSQQKVRFVLRLLKSWMVENPNDSRLLQPLITDYNHISTNIEEYGRMLENTVPVVTSLVQIFEARRAYIETSNISRLTILALIFVPLNYISSLFSMNLSVAPGSTHFWVYFVVAIPVTLLVVVVARYPSPHIWNISAWVEALGRSRFRSPETV
jgi:hypothetical protein